MILVNNEKIQVGCFPNNELNVDKPQVERLCAQSVSGLVVEMIYESSEDLIVLMMIRKYCKEFWHEFDHEGLSLIVKYFPYSRMDRINENFLFSLKYIAEFINELGFTDVTIHEAHSDVTPALLRGCELMSVVDNYLDVVLQDMEFDKDKDFLFFPDAGAQKRYAHLVGYKTLVANKVRDFKTGDIIRYTIEGATNPSFNIPEEERPKVLIIDDLCSRGGTFLHAAIELKDDAIAGEVSMFVGHCEQNVFSGDLFEDDLINKIYTINSMVRDDFYKIINVEEL